MSETHTVVSTPVHPSWLTFLDKLLGIFQAVAPVVSVIVPQAAPAIGAIDALVTEGEKVATEAGPVVQAVEEALPSRLTA